MSRGESRVVSEGRGHLEVVAAQALTNNQLFKAIVTRRRENLDSTHFLSYKGLLQSLQKKYFNSQR